MNELDPPAGGPETWPKTISEAVERLIETLPPESLADVRDLRDDELVWTHFGLGLYVRNNFGLWAGNRELLESCATEENGGVPPAHVRISPDDASGMIVEALRERLRLESAPDTRAP